MKKRMFITTIVMMLVLAVALTTSSLAWFSSANTSVTASTATFYASTSGNSSLNLKISDTQGTWGNSITLTSGAEAGSMKALIPTESLITDTAVGADIATTGVLIDGTTYPVSHKGYTWPSTMSFNGAKIGDEGQFIVDSANPIETVSGVARDGSAGYYYDYFFIHNSGQSNDNNIGSLRFQVESSLTATQSGDYTCNAYAAFILFDLVPIAIDGVIPANALSVDTASTSVANKTVVAKTATATEGQINANDDGVVNVWIPFAAFTIAVDNTGTVTEAPWQFADLSNKNNQQTSSLPVQEYDALSGNGDSDGFLLNSASLRVLNNKVAYDTATTGFNAGSVKAGANVSGNYARDNQSGADTSSEFLMKANETYLVALYFWLDGYTMTNFTDTTVATLKVNVIASAN